MDFRPSSLLFALPLLLASGAHAQRTSPGTLSIVRQVLATHRAVSDPTAPSIDFENAVEGEELLSGEVIQTRKRSYAELSLTGGAAARLDTETSVALRSEAAGVQLTLVRGSLHVKAGSSPITVKTAQAQLTATDATVVVRRRGDVTEVAVLAGKVTIQQGERSLTVAAGNQWQVEVAGSRVALGGIEPIDTPYLPTELGGSIIGFWHRIERERGLKVFPGTPAAMALRSSPLTEIITQIGTLPPDPRRIAQNVADRNRLLAIVRQTVVPRVEQDLAADATLTLGTYATRFGAQGVADRFPVGGSDLAFLLDRGVGNVSQLFDALSVSGGTLGLDIRSPHATRSIWRPSSLAGAPNSEFRLFDAADTAPGYGLAGILLGALAERGSLRRMVTEIEGSVFGITADPQAIGARGAVTARAGRTTFQWEANATRLLSGSQSESFDQGASILSAERALSDNLSVFVGRRRFYSGPVFQNQVRSQLLADRYTGVGATLRSGATTTQLAFLHDANPDAGGSQAGALASISRPFGGGLLGVQALRAPRLRSGTGVTLSAVYPVVAGEMDAYGEVGRGPDDTNLFTAGLYFPAFFQQNDIDLFVEYGNHDKVARTLSFIASREWTSGPAVRLFGSVGRQPDRTSGFAGGVAVLYRYRSR